MSDKMNKYNNFLQFYKKNIDKLHSKSLRPAKSITRNIITGVLPFVNYYKNYQKISFTDIEIQNNVLELNNNIITSTTRDNIRNLEELQFIIKSKKNQNIYKFTRNFIDFINSGLNLKEYLINKIMNINDIHDITMFYNCILSILFDGLQNNEIISYPDSFKKFVKKVPNIKDRIYFCKKVYDIYGFHGKNEKFGNYTPNANYRFLSTCCSLDIIKLFGKNKFGLLVYKISFISHFFYNC